MRTDARLQRVEPRLRLGLHTRAPLFDHIEIAQQRGADQRAQGDVAQHEAPAVLRGQSQVQSEQLIEDEDECAAGKRDRQHHRVGDEHAMQPRQALQPDA